jgi:Domain of Unknown Function (DUF928)
MIRTKLLSWISIVVYTFTFFLAGFTMWVPPAQADCIFIIFCSPKKSSFRSKGGVRRGPCAAEEIGSLIALAPERKPELTIASGEKVGSTVQAYPTFWFYLPPHHPSITSAKFVLLDENRHLVHDPIYAQLPHASAGVIAGLTLPSNGKALEVGKQYSWYFSILCDPQKPSRNPEVTGQIQRVLQSPLPRAKEPAYIVYDNTYTGQNGIENVVFYDTITQLVKKHNTYLSDWERLLKNSGILQENSKVPEILELHLLSSPPENCDSSKSSVM